jgi:DNA polymerase (family 10)
MKPGMSPRETVSLINGAVARCFDEIAELLGRRRATDFRIAAYQRGAAVLRELLCPIDRIYEDSGRAGLEEIPGLGRSLALSVEKFLQTGLMPTLELLRGNGLSQRFMRSAENPRRRPVANDSPQFVIQRTNTVPVPSHDSTLPSVDELLSIDAEYREKAANDELVRIAPRQFNPTGAEWLPILHARRNRWHYTAAFSNTAHAHREGKTQDWVIIHRDARGHAGQWTVIMSLFGALKGRRIVRGREAECQAFYRQHPASIPTSEEFERDDRPRQKLLFDLDN